MGSLHFILYDRRSFAMRPSLGFYHLLLFFVLAGQTDEYYTGGAENNNEVENQAVDYEGRFQVAFNPSPMLAFVPARSCHVQFRKDFGTFSPPVFYGNIDVNLWCNWTVLAAPGKHIVIYITGFRTNEDCNENHDEIVFEGVSSSVESSIVYACWNKHTHVFATQALAVNVVLLWRSFSHHGSKRYFIGRYYVFNDPVFEPMAHVWDSSLVTNKQNKSTSVAITTVYSSALPKSSISKIFHTITKVEREQHSAIQAHWPTLKFNEIMVSHESDLHTDISSTVVCHFSPSYDTSTVLWPAGSPAYEAADQKEHLESWTSGSLEPSLVRTWEAMSQTIWASKVAPSQLIPETPYVNITYTTELSEQLPFSISHAIRIPETQHFSKHSIIRPTNVSVYHVVENTVLLSFSTSLKVEPQGSSHFSTAHTIDFTQVPGFSVVHTAGGHDHPLFSKPYAAELVEDPHFSIAHTVALSGIPYFSVEPTVEFTKMPHPSVVSLTELLEKEHPHVVPSVGFLDSENPSIAASVELPEMPHPSVAPLIELLVMKHSHVATTVEIPAIPHATIAASAEIPAMPYPIIATTVAIPTMLHASIAASVELPVMPYPSVASSVDLLERIHPYLASSIELQEMQHPIIATTAELSEMLHPSVAVSDLPEVPHLRVTPSVKFINMSYPSLNISVELKEMQHPIVAPYFEQLERPHPSVATSVELTEILYLMVTPSVKLLDMPHPSIVPSVEQPKSPYLSEAQNIDFMESSQMSAVVATDLPEMSKFSVLNFPLHSSTEQPFVASYISTKSINKDIAGQIANDPYHKVKYKSSQFVSPGKPPFKLNSSILGFPILRLNSTHLSAVKQPLFTLSPKSSVIVSNHQILPGDNSQIAPKFPNETIFSGHATQISETINQMAILIQNASPIAAGTQTMKTRDYKHTESITKPTRELQLWQVKQTTDATDPKYLPLPNNKWQTSTFANEATTTRLTIAEIKSTSIYQTNSDLDLFQKEDIQPKSDSLDNLNTVRFFGNQTILGFPHVPGDSLFAITTEIEHKNKVLKGLEKELVESVSKKITDIYFPNGVTSLMLKEIRWTNMSRVILTFWLHLKNGGKAMNDFLKTQLKALESHSLGSFNAVLVSFSVEDVNECQLGIQNCSINAYCVNTFGTYSCPCLSGYKDHSPAASGTVCISSQPAEIYSLSEQLEILVGSISSVAATLLLFVAILCIIKQRRRAKAKFNLQNRTTMQHGAHVRSPYTVNQSELGQALSVPTMHQSLQHTREHYPARETSSTVELTVEQTAC
ncbi:uncharacterized protein LOC134910441 isoform X2 [Pseudophryne corroboree]|uniref:uncharacterized protein LOC134910441 isoform X2 n=1 Tax=Pseudophryne corroboree TaxID=495146 RepID=UPI003081D0E3